jgi:hypothetical protein
MFNASFHQKPFQIHSILKIGSFHTNFCEDFLIYESLSPNIQVLAVMDGCTMGKESTFASLMIGKILRKTCKTMFYQDLRSPISENLEILIQSILKDLFQELKHQKNKLLLETEELLSTLIIIIIDTQKQEALSLVVGDGCIYCDEKLYEYEQNNKPDYLGYHLHKNFDEWYISQNQKLYIQEFQNFAICTDGIFSFQKQKSAIVEKTETDFTKFLLSDNTDFHLPHFFEKKLRFIEQNWLYNLTDDLAIIRFSYL